MNNLQQLIQMGQQLQSKVAELQERLDAQEITSSAGGGMVRATVDGKGTTPFGRPVGTSRIRSQASARVPGPGPGPAPEAGAFATRGAGP